MLKYTYAFFAFIVVCSCSSCKKISGLFDEVAEGTTLPIPSPIPGYDFVWSDEFEGDQVDTAVWKYRDWAGWLGPTMCLPENVSIVDGKMKIEMKKETYVDSSTAEVYEATAGGLITKNRFKFGYYEVSAKLSAVKGWHEAFWGHWTSSNDPSTYFPGWQTAPRTEIDCFEHTAEYDNTTYTYGMYKITGVWPNEQSTSIHRDMHFGTTDLTNQFNTFGFEYTPEYLNYFFNGDIIKTVDMREVEHQNFHLWLTAIATRVPDASSEIFWDYLRCFAPDTASTAYLQRRNFFVQLLDDRLGDTTSTGTDLWIEAEDFPVKGGWSVAPDGDATVLTGNTSPPADDADRFARTKIHVLEDGAYRLWVRAKDFKDNLPGTRYFQVRINGAIFQRFGTHGSDELYDWEDGGVVNLESGEHIIELYDASNYYAKCDKILLTTDLNFTPNGIGGASNVVHIDPVDVTADLWIEAENFSQPRGWQAGTDSGLGVLMGRSSPPAHDSLRNAITTISVSEGGQYRLWVRGKDVKDDQPGRRHFEVSINGESSTELFGTHMSELLYDWQDGGVFDLEVGANVITLYDSSLFWARCDKILLTNRLSFIPDGLGEAENVIHQ